MVKSKPLLHCWPLVKLSKLGQRSFVCYAHLFSIIDYYWLCYDSSQYRLLVKFNHWSIWEIRRGQVRTQDLWVASQALWPTSWPHTHTNKHNHPTRAGGTSWASRAGPPWRTRWSRSRPSRPSTAAASTPPSARAGWRRWSWTRSGSWGCGRRGTWSGAARPWQRWMSGGERVEGGEGGSNYWYLLTVCGRKRCRKKKNSEGRSDIL